MQAIFQALSLAAAASVALSGCYVVPGNPQAYPVYPAHPGYPPYPYAVPVPPLPPSGPPHAAAPTVLQARLYPANERASRGGMLNGTVTNTSFGKGRFQLNYRGETLSGEATRVEGDTRRGVASAYGPSGTFMSCEYQMQSASQGAGTCTLSDGATCQVHIGG